MARKPCTKTPLADSIPDEKRETDTGPKFITYLASCGTFPCTHQPTAGWRLSCDSHPPGRRVTSNFLPDDQTLLHHPKRLFPLFTASDTADRKTYPLYG